MKNLFATLRYTTIAALLAIAFVFSGCKDDDDAGPVTFDGSIYAFITQDQFKQATSGDADSALDSLVMYLDKFPDLKAELSGTTELTLFAPSNTAFKNLTSLPGLTDPDRVNQDIIKGVLAYHIVNGKKTSADFTTGATIATQYAPGGTPDVIKINDGGTLFTGSSNDKIVIHTSDQMTTNGVVHTTETVLIPTAIGGTLKNILGTLAATVLLGSDFTYMAYLIGVADSEAGTNIPISAILASRDSTLTLLAVPNAVFEAYAAGALEKENPTDTEIKAWLTSFTAAGARGVLLNHILTTQYIVGSSDDEHLITFKNNGQITNALSGKLIISTTGNDPAECGCVGVVLAANDGVSLLPIYQADISSQVGISNGVMQVVLGIILNFPG